MIKKVHLFAFAQAILSTIFGLYIASIENRSFVIGNEVFTKPVQDSALQHYVIAILGFGILYLIIYYLSHKESITKSDRQLYNNICQKVFDSYIKNESSYHNPDFRVSLFKVRQGLVLKEGKWYKPSFDTVLCNVGRHQSTQEMKFSKVKFLPNQGCVGVCYMTSLISFENIANPYNENAPIAYISENETRYKLPPNKTKKLRVKAQSFVSCPVYYWNSHELIGVIVVDCVKDINFSTSNFRLIGDTVDKFSVNFNKEK